MEWNFFSLSHWCTSDVDSPQMVVTWDFGNILYSLTINETIFARQFDIWRRNDWSWRWETVAVFSITVWVQPSVRGKNPHITVVATIEIFIPASDLRFALDWLSQSNGGIIATICGNIITLLSLGMSSVAIMVSVRV